MAYLYASIPEGMHNIDAQKAGIYAIVLDEKDNRHVK